MMTNKIFATAALAAALSVAGIGAAYAKDSSWGTISSVSDYTATDTFSVAKTSTGTFSDVYSFTLYGSAIDANASFYLTNATTINNTTVASITSFNSVLYDATGKIVASTWDGATQTSYYTNLAAGSYTLKVTGTTQNISSSSKTVGYSGTFSVTAVPEPESYAMLLAGLGLMGTIARRRNKAKAD